MPRAALIHTKVRNSVYRVHVNVLASAYKYFVKVFAFSWHMLALFIFRAIWLLGMIFS